MRISAIIVAAGSSSRMKAGNNGADAAVSKVFSVINGKTVLERTLSSFEKAEAISELVVVCREEDMAEVRGYAADFSKPIAVTAGGKTRQQSVLNGIKLAEGDYFAIHDGARPFASPELIERACADGVRHGAASAAVKLKDTVKTVDESGFVTATPDRAAMMSVQTPQVFERELYMNAVKQALDDGKDFTDDCQLIEYAGGRVHLCEGDYRNIKITTPEDLLVAEAFAADFENAEGEAKMIRVGCGYDVHKLVEGRKLILGGVEIPHEKGLLGHSDADVLLHAISDAVLGAAAMGDIGKIFPDTDEKYKGADSLVLLREIVRLVRENGYAIGNIDATIVAQRPKISPYITAMRENIAGACGVSTDCVSVKATTEEKLGFTGAEEGMSAQAVCLLEKL